MNNSCQDKLNNIPNEELCVKEGVVRGQVCRGVKACLSLVPLLLAGSYLFLGKGRVPSALTPYPRGDGLPYKNDGGARRKF